MSLANKLTFIRIILIIPFIIFLLQDSCIFRTIALFFFISASITDYYDGKIARSRKEVSTLGKFLDPLADKLFISSALIVLVYIDDIFVPVWAVILIIAREFIVNGLRTLAASEGRIIVATRAGKLKTTVQMIAIILIILILIIQKFLYAAYYIAVITALLTLYTGIDYIVHNRDIIISKIPKRQDRRI